MSREEEALVQPPGSGPGGDRRPIPDPTVLTTEALSREINHVTDLFGKDIERLDEALRLAEASRVEQKSDTKQALGDALSAAKEAVTLQTIAADKAITKSEGGTTKQISDMATTFNTALTGMTTILTDLKDRVTRLETSLSTGALAASQQRGTDQWSLTTMLGALAFLVSTTLAIVLVVRGH